MSHWLDKLVDILSADTVDLRELAEIAGFDPKFFYIGTDISGADIRGQNLEGMKFSNFQLSQVKVDSETRIDGYGELRFDDEIDELVVKMKLVEIKRLGRQEERVIAAIRLCMDHPDVCGVVFDQYNESSKFAKNLFLKFKESGIVSADRKGIDVRLSVFMDQILNVSFPLSRGYALRYIAKYFGDFKYIRMLVNRRLIRNYTMSNHYDDIKAILDDWEVNIKDSSNMKSL